MILPTSLRFILPGPSPARTILIESAYFHTGGTTSAPKLVQHTQRGQLLNAWISASILGPEQDEIVGLGLPNFHVAGAILTKRALIMGQTLLVLRPGDFAILRWWRISGSRTVEPDHFGRCGPNVCGAVWG
jgi:acyl-CoA synthetase (AMP-forming)/AMP-acid ligase II